MSLRHSLQSFDIQSYNNCNWRPCPRSTSLATDRRKISIKYLLSQYPKCSTNAGNGQEQLSFVATIYHGRQTQQSADRARSKSRSAAPSRSTLDGQPTTHCPTIARSRQNGEVDAEDKLTVGSAWSKDVGDTEATSSMSVPVSEWPELAVEHVLPRSARKLSDESRDRLAISSSSGNDVITGKSWSLSSGWRRSFVCKTAVRCRISFRCITSTVPSLLQLDATSER